MICTIGSGLEELANQVMETEMVHGLALYGAGSAAVEALANAACQRFEAEAAGHGWHTTIPLRPGNDWLVGRRRAAPNFLLARCQLDWCSPDKLSHHAANEIALFGPRARTRNEPDWHDL